MTSSNHYFEYLQTRSRLALLYRRWWLYPRLTRRLGGLTLDIGCGIGDMLSFRPNTVGVDVNIRLVEHCRSLGFDARLMQPDVLPFGDAHFDSVLLDNVLEHIASPQPLLAEINRVVRPAGRLLIGVPGEKGWAADPDHKNRYDEKSLEDTVKQAGFRCEEFFYSPLGRSEWVSRSQRLYCIWVSCIRT